jgi:glycosyltransferase involved in cell wall biosynthesis
MDIIALTSLNEGTPVSLIEAQAAGKPIVSTRTGGIEDVVLEGQTALLSPVGDSEAFTANLRLLAEQEDLRREMSQKGQSFVMERFHYQRLVQDMSYLYDRLLFESDRG